MTGGVKEPPTPGRRNYQLDPGRRLLAALKSGSQGFLGPDTASQYLSFGPSACWSGSAPSSPPNSSNPSLYHLPSRERQQHARDALLGIIKSMAAGTVAASTAAEPAAASGRDTNTPKSQGAWMAWDDPALGPVSGDRAATGAEHGAEYGMDVSTDAGPDEAESEVCHSDSVSAASLPHTQAPEPLADSHPTTVATPPAGVPPLAPTSSVESSASSAASALSSDSAVFSRSTGEGTTLLPQRLVYSCQRYSSGQCSGKKTRVVKKKRSSGGSSTRASEADGESSTAAEDSAWSLAGEVPPQPADLPASCPSLALSPPPSAAQASPLAQQLYSLCAAGGGPRIFTRVLYLYLQRCRNHAAAARVVYETPDPSTLPMPDFVCAGGRLGGGRRNFATTTPIIVQESLERLVEM